MKPKRKQCSGITARGTRCKRKAVTDGFCRIHNTPQEGVGARRALTAEVEKKILDAVRAGAFYKEAALAAGIGISTLHEWRQRGQGDDADPQFAEFAAAVEQARAAAHTGAVVAIRIGMSTDWRAAAWWLERTDFEHFGRRTRLEHAGPSNPDDQPVRISHELITDPAVRDQLGALKRGLADSRAERPERPGAGGGPDPPPSGDD